MPGARRGQKRVLDGVAAVFDLVCVSVCVCGLDINISNVKITKLMRQVGKDLFGATEK